MIDGDYNIFEDQNSFAARKAHRDNLDAYIASNPEVAGIKTADFADFLSDLSALEGGYNKTAGKTKRYSGWYGIEGGAKLSDNDQHKKAFPF